MSIGGPILVTGAASRVGAVGRTVVELLAFSKKVENHIGAMR